MNHNKMNAYTHEICYDLAHGSSKNEVLQQIWDEGEGHAEHSHHQITDSQREEEGVGDCPHSFIHHQNHNDQQVAKDTEQEYQRV